MTWTVSQSSIAATRTLFTQMIHYLHYYTLNWPNTLSERLKKATQMCTRAAHSKIKMDTGAGAAAPPQLLIFHSVILSHFPWFWFRFCQSSSQIVIVDYSGMCLGLLPEPQDRNRQCPFSLRWHSGLICLDIQSLSFHAISSSVCAVAPQSTVTRFKSVLDAGNPGPTLRVINRDGGRRARVSVFPPEARRWTAELFLLAPSSSPWHRQIAPPRLPRTPQTSTFPLLF